MYLSEEKGDRISQGIAHKRGINPHTVPQDSASLASCGRGKTPCVPRDSSAHPETGNVSFPTIRPRSGQGVARWPMTKSRTACVQNMSFQRQGWFVLTVRENHTFNQIVSVVQLDQERKAKWSLPFSNKFLSYGSFQLLLAAKPQ